MATSLYCTLSATVGSIQVSLLEGKNKLAVALELLKLDSVQSRVLSALASIQPEHDYEGTQKRRQPRLRGAGARFMVLNSQNRSVFASRDLEMAEFRSEIRSGRQLLDLKAVPTSERRRLTNALRHNPGGKLKAIIPPIPPRAQPKSNKQYDPQDKVKALLDEVAKEVSKLRLPPEESKQLTYAACQIARSLGREQALDLVFEISLLQFTCILDQLTGEVTDVDDPADASLLCKELNESPDGMLMLNGKPTGRYRYKTVKPFDLGD